MKERLVRFGHLVLSPSFLKNCERHQEYGAADFLSRNLKQLTPEQIRQGLSQRDGSLLLKQTCAIAEVNYEEITKGA